MLGTFWQCPSSEDDVPDGICDEPLPVDPLGGAIRLTAADLADCPPDVEDVERWFAADRGDARVDDWWADPVAAQREWDADLAALYAQVAADDRRDALERRAVLDGAPGLGSFAASLEVLGGAAAWTPEQAGAEGFVDDLADGAISGFAAARRVENHALWLQVAHAAVVVRAFTGRTPSLPRRTRSG
ncbi:MAG: hypothetical protein HY830_12405, partial [Actinobacteria bacterium]|nr:hypothetical protein [Actinomycetota bacterium]